MQARLLDTSGWISKEVFDVNYDDRDHKGNPMLESKVRKVRSHPSRILPVIDGVQVYRGTDTTDALLANCPACAKAIQVDVKNVRQAQCQDHGPFHLSWATVKAGRIPVSDDIIATKTPKRASTKKKSMKPRAQRAIKAPINIDFAVLHAAGELWTRAGVAFDYPGFDVRAHVLLLTGTRPRKFCFNSYNGTWGKKSKDHELTCFLEDRTTDTGSTVGWEVKGTLDQERRKLTKSGYKRDSLVPQGAK